MSEPTSNPQQNPQDAGTGTGGGQTQVSFTQEQLDKLFKPRMDEAAQKAVKDLLTSLNVPDVDTLKSTLGEVEKAKKAQMTELDQVKSDAAKAQKERDDAKAQAEQAVTLANTRLLEALVIAEASNPEHKFKPEAIRDVWAFVDRSKLAIAEDGTVTGVADVVKAVAKAKPYMVQAEAAKTPAGPGTPPRQRTGQQPQTTPNGNVPEQTYEQPLVKL